MFSGIYDHSNRSANQGLSAPVVICQIEWEIETLVEFYRQLKPMKVMEIGVQFGGTLYCWLMNAQPGATIIGVDHWNKNEMVEDPRPRWKRWVPSEVNFYPIIGDSHLQETKDQIMAITETFDFLFIDGDHTYEGSRQDWLMYGPLVSHGGAVVFHDLIKPSFSPHIGVGKLWREIQRAGYITRELHASPKEKETWGGIGIVYILKEENNG